MSQKRILKEIDAGYKSKEFEFIYDQAGKYGDKNNCYIKFTVKSGFYENQTHVLQLRFIYGDSFKQYNFPIDPPNVTFITPIYHANVGHSGAICLDVIKPEAWSAMYGIETIFNSIIALLDCPNDNSPLNGEAANNHARHQGTFKEICFKYYTEHLKDRALIMLQAEDYGKC